MLWGMACDLVPRGPQWSTGESEASAPTRVVTLRTSLLCERRVSVLCSDNTSDENSQKRIQGNQIKRRSGVRMGRTIPALIRAGPHGSREGHSRPAGAGQEPRSPRAPCPLHTRLHPDSPCTSAPVRAPLSRPLLISPSCVIAACLLPGRAERQAHDHGLDPLPAGRLAFESSPSGRGENRAAVLSDECGFQVTPGVSPPTVNSWVP